MRKILKISSLVVGVLAAVSLSGVAYAAPVTINLQPVLTEAYGGQYNAVSLSLTSTGGFDRNYINEMGPSTCTFNLGPILTGANPILTLSDSNQTIATGSEKGCGLNASFGGNKQSALMPWNCGTYGGYNSVACDENSSSYYAYRYAITGTLTHYDNATPSSPSTTYFITPAICTHNDQSAILNPTITVNWDSSANQAVVSCSFNQS